MENDVRTLLFDIVESSTLIEDFVAEINFEQYFKSAKTKAAVERHFINIGEALNRIKQIDDSTFGQIDQAPQIIGFRNVLVHGYDVVSDELVWGIVKEKLPVLKSFCGKLLNSDE
jgi:uncharacterized protein with HEPN domain